MTCSMRGGVFPADTPFTWPGTVQPRQHMGHSEGVFSQATPQSQLGTWEIQMLHSYLLRWRRAFQPTGQRGGVDNEKTHLPQYTHVLTGERKVSIQDPGKREPWKSQPCTQPFLYGHWLMLKEEGGAAG